MERLSQRGWRGVLVAAVLVGLFCLAGRSAWAQDKAPASPGDDTKSEAKVAPDAAKVLERLKAHYRGLKGVSVKAAMTNTMKMDGEEEKQTQAVLLVAARPNMVSIREATEEGGEKPADDPVRFALTSDGKTLWQFFGAPLNKYSEDPAPADFSGIVTKAVMGGGGQGPEMVVASPHSLVLTLLDTEGFGKLCDTATKIALAGREEIGGRACDKLHFTFERIEADMWVRAEGGEGKGEAWVERVVPDLMKMYADMPGLPADFKDQLPRQETNFTDWRARPDIPAETFAFKPPEGADKVKSWEEAFAAMGGEEGKDPGEETREKLLGKAAPEIGLELLDAEGVKVNLAAHKGKEVVILDFWATWCPPCVAGLPVISKTAAGFKEKGVVFYAVNQQETAAKVRAFLKKKELEIKVLLDKQGSVAQKYGVTGIPQTVLIGRDGTVQAIHVGFDPSMEEEISSEIGKLAEGKKLVEEKKEGDKDGEKEKPDRPDK